MNLSIFTRRLSQFNSISVCKESMFPLLAAKIKLSGPITIAEYMKEVLTNNKGYYMKRDVFGRSGDFTTSPEISQLFGEILGIWCIHELKKLGNPKPLKLVELGPGRGTLTQDLLRVFKKLNDLKDLSIHLVEVSPALSAIQAKALCTKSEEALNSLHYKEGVTPDGIPVYWYYNVQQIPNDGFTCLVANEFFDALPIHKFQKTESGWREILIDLDPLSNNSSLRYVISNNPTPASISFIEANETREHIEICPQAGVIMEHLATRFEEHGGLAVVCDYGHSSTKTDTFRAFKGHQLADPLVDPGTADLTADVDFTYLKRSVNEKLISFGPVTQEEFLKKLHIEARLKVLLERCKNKEEESNLLSSFKMLMDPNQMGEKFKVVSFFPAVLNKFLELHPPEGFV